MDGLLYFQSHLAASVVNFSSDESVIPVSTYLAAGARRAAPPHDDESEAHSLLLEGDEFQEAELHKAAKLIAAADAVIVLAGAGMSADSNVSTFRPCDHEKLSDQQKSTSSNINFSTSVNSTPTSSGSMMRSISLEQACYQKFPEKAWCYDAGYRETIHRSSPHEGYTLLLDLLRRKDRPFFVMTTNIDRYFAQAGFPESQLYETHGSVDTLQCAKVGTKRCPGVWPWPQETPLPTFNRVDATVDLNTVPKCIHCGGMARCNITHLPDDAADVDGSLKDQQRRVFIRWLNSLHQDVVNDSCSHRAKKKKLSEGKISAAADGSGCSVKSNQTILVLELGCGGSVHGLRTESELLLSDHPSIGFGSRASFVRVNPEAGSPAPPLNHPEDDKADFPSTFSSFVRLGALPALQRLSPLVLQYLNQQHD